MGMQLKPPSREPPSILVKVRLPGAVGAQLAIYREMYRESYGEEIRTEALAAEIIGQFLERDPELRRRVRAQRQRAKGAPGGHDQGPSAGAHEE